MFDLSENYALVTGATGGIGEAIATQLHAQGATVAISGTRKEKLEEVAAKLGERVHIVDCNLSDGEAVEALIGRAEEAHGPIDILVNNAGITRDGLTMRIKNSSKRFRSR